MSDLLNDEWRLNVAAIILDEADNVLVGSTPGKSPYWHFPQGGVNKDETFEEAVLREVWEEVGLPPEACSILASYGGIRYRYRHKNKKSERWLGQQQTYYLIRCRGVQPLFAGAAVSQEFAQLRWVPWRLLTADMFVPFKREAVVKAMRVFFSESALPPGEAVARLSPCRYRIDAECALAECPAVDDALFGGGKEEMPAQLEDISTCINREQRRVKQGKLLVWLCGLPGSGLTNGLRRLARRMDPLFTHAVQPGTISPEALAALLPAAGECRLLLDSLGANEMLDFNAVRQLCREYGVTLLPVYLHVSHAEHCKRADSPMSAGDWEARLCRVARYLGSCGGDEVAYAIPADKRWYRDYVLAVLVAEALKKMK